MENLIDALTAKNSEYIHSVTKQLMLAGKTDEEIKEILNEILPEIIEGQENGQLARKTLGTPTEFVEKYAPKKAAASAKKGVTDENEKPILMWLDTTLLFFGFISIVSGILGIFSPKDQVYGVTTILIMSALGGVVLYMIYRFYYSQAAGKRRWTIKNMVLTAVALIVWAIATSLVALLPRTVNPILNGYIIAVIGALVLVVKYFVKRKFHIRSTFSPTPTK